MLTLDAAFASGGGFILLVPALDIAAHPLTAEAAVVSFQPAGRPPDEAVVSYLHNREPVVTEIAMFGSVRAGETVQIQYSGDVPHQARVAGDYGPSIFGGADRGGMPGVAHGRLGSVVSFA